MEVFPREVAVQQLCHAHNIGYDVMQGRVVGYRKLLQLNRQKLCFGILFIKFITKHSFGSSLAGTSRFSL